LQHLLQFGGGTVRRTCSALFPRKATQKISAHPAEPEESQILLLLAVQLTRASLETAVEGAESVAAAWKTLPLVPSPIGVFSSLVLVATDLPVVVVAAPKIVAGVFPIRISFGPLIQAEFLAQPEVLLVPGQIVGCAAFAAPVLQLTSAFLHQVPAIALPTLDGLSQVCQQCAAAVLRTPPLCTSSPLPKPSAWDHVHQLAASHLSHLARRSEGRNLYLAADLSLKVVDPCCAKTGCGSLAHLAGHLFQHRP